jgi:hypothetical protein
LWGCASSRDYALRREWMRSFKAAEYSGRRAIRKDFSRLRRRLFLTNPFTLLARLYLAH